MSAARTESSGSMSEMQGEKRSAVVFGARNLGRAVIELLVSDGWAVTGAARSRSTLDGVSAAGALALEADVTDPASVYGVLEQAAAAHGGVDLVVNAAAAYGGERTGPFGGGPIAEADRDGFDSWAAAPARAAFSFLSASGRFAVAQGRAATLVQVTGGSARRAMAGRGLWAAGSFGVRAITNAAALELRPRGIQVTLLIVDAGIQPLDGSTRPVSRRSPGGPAQDRRCRPLPRQPGRALRDTRAPAHPARRELDPLSSGDNARTVSESPRSGDASSPAWRQTWQWPACRQEPDPTDGRSSVRTEQRRDAAEGTRR